MKERGRAIAGVLWAEHMVKGTRMVKGTFYFSKKIKHMEKGTFYFSKN